MRRRGHAQSDVGGILDRNAGTGDCLQRMATGIKVERSIVTRERNVPHCLALLMQRGGEQSMR